MSNDIVNFSEEDIEQISNNERLDHIEERLDKLQIKIIGIAEKLDYIDSKI